MSKKSEKEIYYPGITICQRCGKEYPKYDWKCPRCGLPNPEGRND